MNKNTSRLVISHFISCASYQFTLTPAVADGVWWRFLCNAQNVTAHGVPQAVLVIC